MLYSENSLGQSTQLLIQQQLTGLQSMLRASQLGISPEEVASLSQQASLTRQKVNFDSKGKMTVGEDNSTVQYKLCSNDCLVHYYFDVCADHCTRDRF